jgi:hypothetical protein
MADELTHTPGPWGYVPSPPFGGFEIAPAADIERGDWSREVAATYRGNEADARLIAAAPDLLDALEECEGYFTGHATVCRVGPVGRAILDRARAAIAKAEGRQP